MNEEKKEEFTGLRKVLEKYSYLDDVINQLAGLQHLIDQCMVKVEAFLRRDSPLKSKREVIEKVRKYRDEIVELSNYIKKNAKTMNPTDKRVRVQDLINKVRELLRELDRYV